MSKTRDILAKVWLRRRTDGILSRRLCGGRIDHDLPTEQPTIANRQVDMLVRNDQGAIHHVEFQASNEADFPFRMLEYWVYLRRYYQQPVWQCVFYIGREALRIPSAFEERETRHRYEIVNLHEYQADELLRSPDWGDNLWALGARGDRAEVLGELLRKLQPMTGADRESALAELTAFSGILKLDELLSEKLKEFSMLTIDLRDNAVVRPLMEESHREGVEEGRRDLLLELLAEKFGAVPTWASERVRAASADQLDRWARKILRSDSLEDTLA